jgi:hypothetical protein
MHTAIIALAVTLTLIKLTWINQARSHFIIAEAKADAGRWQSVTRFEETEKGINL